MESITRRIVAIDRYSGKLLYTNYGNRQTAGDIFDEWQLSLHSGEAFGFAGRVLWCIVGFAPLILYVTGILRWLQKRRAAKQHQLKCRSHIIR